jgi:cysteine desulfurase
MLANNETGVIQPVAEAARIAHAHGALLHCDAVQAAGKIAVDFAASGAQLMSLSGHKIYGPKGVGALIVDSSVELRPLLVGGGHEKGRRSGTENVAAIVGFGAAAELARARLADEGVRLRGLRERLEAGLRALGGIEVFGQEAPRLPNTVYFGAPGMDGPTLLLALDRAGFACASGSACGSDSHEPSPVLRAMGIEAALARGALRVSLGAGNTAQDVDGFLDALGAQLQQLQRMARRAVG